MKQFLIHCSYDTYFKKFDLTWATGKGVQSYFLVYADSYEEAKKKLEESSFENEENKLVNFRHFRNMTVE